MYEYEYLQYSYLLDGKFGQFRRSLFILQQENLIGSKNVLCLHELVTPRMELVNGKTSAETSAKYLRSTMNEEFFFPNRTRRDPEKHQFTNWLLVAEIRTASALNLVN